MYHTPVLGACSDLILVIVLEAKRNGGAGFLGESALFCTATASGKIITVFFRQYSTNPLITGKEDTIMVGEDNTARGKKAIS